MGRACTGCAAGSRYNTAHPQAAHRQSLSLQNAATPSVPPQGPWRAAPRAARTPYVPPSPSLISLSLVLSLSRSLSLARARALSDCRSFALSRARERFRALAVQLAPLTGWSFRCPPTKGRGWRERPRCLRQLQWPRAAATCVAFLFFLVARDSRGMTWIKMTILTTLNYISSRRHSDRSAPCAFRVYSSVVEQLTADQQVSSSNLDAPFHIFFVGSPDFGLAF